MADGEPVGEYTGLAAERFLRETEDVGSGPPETPPSGQAHSHGKASETGHRIGPPSDALTIVIRLPQPFEKVTRVLRAVADEWPDARFVNDLTYLEIPADGG